MSDTLTTNLKYFDLENAQLDYVRKAYDLIRGDMDGMLDKFYEFALSNSEMAGFFQSDAMMAHARQRQVEHWDMLLSGKLDNRYLNSAKTIGEVHFRIQLPFNLYLAGYARVVSMVMAALLQAANRAGVEAPEIEAMTGAVSRAFAFDTENVITAFFAAQQLEQSTALQYLEEGLNRIIEGDVTKPIPSSEDSDFPAKFEQLRIGYNGALDLLIKVCGTIAEMTADLEISTQDVNSATKDLALRTEAQASTLQESAAAVEELTQSVKLSSENAARVDTEMKTARQQAVDAREIMMEAVKSMTDIEESSQQISSKIGAINQIAFQTNLLALNAGVEAARAGEHGRGFAVVASEVRALAVRASDTAKEISDIITASGKQVEAGNEKVGKTGEALGVITENVVKVSDLISQINATAIEQATTLESINQSVSKLDAVTQQNAAMAEETSAAAQAMTISFDGLSQAVSDLGVDIGSETPAAMKRA